jgi:DNA processing protein
VATPVQAIQHEERTYWVMLSMAAGIGPIRFQRLLDACGGARGAWHASQIKLASTGLERRSLEALLSLRKTLTPEGTLGRLSALGISTLTLLDPDYPANLREVADPPPVLFVRGRLADSDATAVALVGTRRASPYGFAAADRLARDLASAGVTIVSGLARGVDTAAHAAALDAGGRTIGVLGNGLDQVYPAENRRLASRVVDGDRGALVSEFAPGVPPDAANFPRRNRIISGMSTATVIVEAGERSGALITADFALEQGRDVLAVPGSIFNPNSVGTNELLKQGATPVTSAEDVLRALGNVSSSTPVEEVAHELPTLSAHQTVVYEALSGEPRNIDELIRAAGLRAGEVSAALTMLELTGLARQVGPMLYTRS